ncbi:hypothetical protein CRG98_045049 [Punica granatum]|uniref:Uncharacterized protein n=1 Tax=Punica granatum TaxID=22663 RepID=A0A2I0HS36_PUNGR|nr:hypothetical protein CRG98_045049 [Punica granatum]
MHVNVYLRAGAGGSVSLLFLPVRGVPIVSGGRTVVSVSGGRTVISVSGGSSPSRLRWSLSRFRLRWSPVRHLMWSPSHLHLGLLLSGSAAVWVCCRGPTVFISTV